MDQMELVESLREKTGCSYSEAKAALDETDGDLLEALCWLENHGKAQMARPAPPRTASRRSRRRTRLRSGNGPTDRLSGAAGPCGRGWRRCSAGATGAFSL